MPTFTCQFQFLNFNGSFHFLYFFSLTWLTCLYRMLCDLVFGSLFFWSELGSLRIVGFCLWVFVFSILFCFLVSEYWNVIVYTGSDHGSIDLLLFFCFSDLDPLYVNPSVFFLLIGENSIQWIEVTTVQFGISSFRIVGFTIKKKKNLFLFFKIAANWFFCDLEIWPMEWICTNSFRSDAITTSFCLVVFFLNLSLYLFICLFCSVGRIEWFLRNYKNPDAAFFFNPYSVLKILLISQPVSLNWSFFRVCYQLACLRSVLSFPSSSSFSLFFFHYIVLAYSIQITSS